MSGLTVHRAQAEHIDRIRSLETEAFGFTWDRPTFLRELTRPNGVTVVAQQGDKVVGAALLVWAAGEVQLNSIVLEQSLRGQGLSINFLGTLMRWSQLQGQNWFTLEVKWDNDPALRLYKRFGFVTTARRRAYYRDGQDARIMWAGHLQSPGFQSRLAPYKCALLNSETAA